MRRREAEKLASEVADRGNWHDGGIIDFDALRELLIEKFEALEPAHREKWKVRPIHLPLRDLRNLRGFLDELANRCRRVSPLRYKSIKTLLAKIVRQSKDE